MKNFTKKGIFRFPVVLIVCSLLVYTSCKKSQVTVTSNTTAAGPTGVATQIAMNFYSALTGQYSGMSINSGINASLNVTSDHSTNPVGKKNPLCGYIIDTTYNNSSISGDTTFASSGTFKFTYTCTSKDIDGYKLSDTLNSSVSDTTYSSVNNVSQKYVVEAIDNTYKKLLTNGLINTTAEYSVLGSGGAVTGYNDIYGSYLMTAVKVDVSSGIADAVSGTAVFSIKIINLPVGSTGKPTKVIYAGIITYLGNHIAKVSVLGSNGKYTSFLVNMITGATTPA